MHTDSLLQVYMTTKKKETMRERLIFQDGRKDQSTRHVGKCSQDDSYFPIQLGAIIIIHIYCGHFVFMLVVLRIMLVHKVVGRTLVLMHHPLTTQNLAKAQCAAGHQHSYLYVTDGVADTDSVSI